MGLFGSKENSEDLMYKAASLIKKPSQGSNFPVKQSSKAGAKEHTGFV